MLNEFIQENCPKLSQLPPLTEAQEKILIQDYGLERVKEMLLRMEAYDKRRYKTLYRTIRNWFKVQKKFQNNRKVQYASQSKFFIR